MDLLNTIKPHLSAEAFNALLAYIEALKAERFAEALETNQRRLNEAVAQAKLEIQTNLDALVQAGQAAHAAGDLSALGTVLEQAAGYTTAARAAARDKRLAELDAERERLLA